MDFPTWTRHLSDRGLRVVPPSHPTPVEVWALLPGEAGLVHFRCRGRTVTLARYAEADLLFTEAAAACSCDRGCGSDLGDPITPPRLTLRPGAGAVGVARYDGASRSGWTGYEAGLLAVDDAAPLFDALLADLLSELPPARRSVGLDGSLLSTTASAVSAGRSAST